MKNVRALILHFGLLLISLAAAGAETSSATTIRYQRGMVIKAQGGGFRNILATRTVPMDWPDQQIVRVVKEEVPPGASLSYKTIEGVGRQMLVKLPSLAAGKAAQVVVTFEIQLLPSPPPVDSATLRLPDASALDRKLSRYLAPGAYIESGDPTVRETAQQVAGGQGSPWEKVQAIHQHVSHFLDRMYGDSPVKLRQRAKS